MNIQPESSGHDESLAMGLYTGVSQLTSPRIRFAHFDYAIRPRRLLDDVGARFSNSLDQPLSTEHMALLEGGEEQSAEDLALVERMLPVQRSTLI